MFHEVGTYLSVCWQPDSRWWFALQPTEIPQFIHRERNPNRHWMRFNDAANLQLNWKRLLAIDKSNVRGGTPEPLFDRTNLHPGRVPYCLNSDTRSPLYTFASASSGTLDSRNSAQLLPLLPSFLPYFLTSLLACLLPYFRPSLFDSKSWSNINNESIPSLQLQSANNDHRIAFDPFQCFKFIWFNFELLLIRPCFSLIP